MIKKLFSLLVLLSTSIFLNIFAQKVGVVENYNSELKHAHLKGFWNYHALNIENLGYNISPYIDSLGQESKLDLKKLDNFDFSELNYFDSRYGNKRIEKKLNEYCKQNGIEALIIIRSQNMYHTLDPLKNTFGNDFDFGILSHKGNKKMMRYYNNIQFLYYIVKTDKLEYPITPRKESLIYPEKPIKVDYQVYDEESKTLNNKEKNKTEFLKDFKTRLKANYSIIVEKIKSSL